MRRILLYSFPIVLFLSYYPLIPLFSTESTNYELSLPLIWLLLFSVLSLKDFARYIYNIYTAKKKQNVYQLLPIIFLVYLSLTILWSSNPLRGVITAGIAWCLYISSITILTKIIADKSFDKHLFLKIFIIPAVVFSLICWVQTLLDSLGVSREITLLCRGCTSRIFGFPHPSGFAIEPQFMGNLLLAPALVSLHLLYNQPLEKSQKIKKLLLTFFLLSTLFLVFSRGAIYSFFAAYLFLLIFNLNKLKNKLFLKSVPLALCSLLLVILSQGVFSIINQKYEKTFSCAISTSISQLSLDVVNLPCAEKNDSEVIVQDNNDSQQKSTPAYTGYIEESTDVRLNLDLSALELASKSNSAWFFGYGLGSAGTTLNKEGKTDSPKEIVQNEYLSLLLETGVIGLAFFFLTITAFLRALRNIFPIKKYLTERYLLYSLTLAFLLSLFFFSGLPNALHIYLFPVFLIFIFSKDKSVIN